MTPPWLAARRRTGLPSSGEEARPPDAGSAPAGTLARAAVAAFAGLGLAGCLAACEEPSRAPPPPPRSTDLALLLSLAEQAGLSGLEGSAHPCAGGVSGVAVSGRGGFLAATSFAESLGRLPSPAHAAVLELLAPEGGPLQLSARICPGPGPRPGLLLLALGDVIPEGAVLTGLASEGRRVRIEGRAASNEVALELAGALRARPEVGSVEVRALGMEGERHTFLLEAELLQPPQDGAPRR